MAIVSPRAQNPGQPGIRIDHHDGAEHRREIAEAVNRLVARQNIYRLYDFVTVSGTEVEFTNINVESRDVAVVRRITVMVRSLSTNGTSGIEVQLGTSSGYTTSGYGMGITDGTTSELAANGFKLALVTGFLATDQISGHMVLTSIDTVLPNTGWVCSVSTGNWNVAKGFSGGGSIGISGVLDRIKIKTINGTDTFDAGTATILVE